MRVMCDYCGSLVSDKLKNCSNCGAVIKGIHRFTKDTPKSIRELRLLFNRNEIPSEKALNFYIGNLEINDSYCIYKDENHDTVIREYDSVGAYHEIYRGIDEEYAVAEFYNRIKEKIIKFENEEIKGEYKTLERNTIVGILTGIIVFIIFISIFVYAILSSHNEFRPTSGYYKYNNELYYYDNINNKNTWYTFDTVSEDWKKIGEKEKPQNINKDNYINYKIKITDFNGEAIENSEAYKENY